MKNLRINKRLAAMLTAGTIALCGVGCDSVNADNKVNLDEILSNSQVKTITTLDDEEKSSSLKYDDVFSIVDKAKQLEEAITIYDILEDEDYSEVDLLKDLDGKERDEALEADIEEIKKLKEISKSKKDDLVSLENRIIAIKKLALIKKNNDDFIKVEGIGIAQEFIKDSVKGSVAAEADTKIDNVKIGEFRGKDSEYMSIKIDDTEYKVKPSNKPMWNGIDYEYTIEISDFKKANEKEIVDTCRKALDYSKNIILSGSNIEDDRIERQYSNSYIKKNILKK